jgi:hypothetical protein
MRDFGVERLRGDDFTRRRVPMWRNTRRALGRGSLNPASLRLLTQVIWINTASRRDV